MQSVSALIAEDEPVLRGDIRRMIGQLWPELVICAEVGDGIQAMDALEKFSPDIVFLDILMPGRSGLELARFVGDNAHVVFITAYDVHALEAFEEGALDYVVKPISLDRMRVTIARLRKRLREPPVDLTRLTKLLETAANREGQFLKWLTIPRASELQVVAVAEILYLQAANKYTTIATRESTFLLTTSLKEMQGKLDPRVFWQINRGIVVNIGAVDRIFRSFRGALEVKVKDRKELLPVSAAHTHLFKPA